MHLLEVFMNTQLLKATDVARLLNISKALVYRLIVDGQLVAVRFGKTVQVRIEDLNDFISKSMTVKVDS
jgi:excisionase family DNA binding protein